MTLTQETIDDLDPGIRDLVIFLNENGFETSDSGDGVSKVDAIAEGNACDFKHVHCSVSVGDLVFEADRLRAKVVEFDPDTLWCVNGTYSADTGTASLSVFELDPERDGFEVGGT